MLDTMPPKKQSAPAEEWPAVVRIPAELRDRLAALGEAMGARAFATLPASVVIRAVLDRGLDALEAELGKAKR
jgi:hypothetical protein